MFHTPASALQAATDRKQVLDFEESDRASAVAERLSTGDELQQSVGALIATATTDFECQSCGKASDPFVFLLEAEGAHHLAVACPFCDASN